MSSRVSKALIMGLLIGLLGVTASIVPLGLNLEEDVGLALLFKLRGVRQAPQDVVVVTADKVSADNLGLPERPDRWPRSVHARLIENLINKGAAVIAFDMIFDEARSVEDDALFAEAINKAGNVVLCECLRKEKVFLSGRDGRRTGELDIEKLVPPIPLLAQSAVALAPFPLPKIPVRLSQYWVIKTGAGDAPTLPAVVFQLFALDVYDDFFRLMEKVSSSQAHRLPADRHRIISSRGVEELVCMLRSVFENAPLLAERMLEELQDSSVLPVAGKRRQNLESLIRMYQGDRSRYLNFYGPPATIPTISYYQLLQEEERSDVTQSRIDLKGKAVFVGLARRAGSEQKDGFHTVFSQPSGLDISGVEIAATAFANLLEDMPVQPFDLPAHLALVFFWGATLGILCLYAPAAAAGAAVIGLSAIYLVAAQYHFTYTGNWSPLVIPLFFQAPAAYFGAILWRYFDVERERRNIKRAFGYYLPDTVVDQLAKDMARINSGSQMVHGTCLFTDAEKYTTLSEKMDPEELGRFMNQYYEAVFDPVKRHGGTVSDVVGDCMLAIWATADPDPDLKAKACLAALDIADAVHRFNQTHDTLKLPTRISLHSGYMLLGNVGAMDHYEYTPVGDIVNTASRMDGLNKYLDTKILISREALSEVDGFLTRELGRFLLVGKTKPVVLYELICRMEHSSQRQRDLCSTFAQALNAFGRQSWKEATDGFNETLRIDGNDGPSIFYLKLCMEYRANPPGEGWDGLLTKSSFDIGRHGVLVNPI
jgi:adenylate cyclase